MKTRVYVLIGSGLYALSLAGGMGLWLRVQQQQYARNRQLIVALDHDDFPKALALVNAGADPNTRRTLPPPPSTKLLLGYLLHISAPPVLSTDDLGQTAFTLVCRCLRSNGTVALRDDDAKAQRRITLLRVMLAHGANVNTSTTAEKTALSLAAYDNEPRIVELLLAHGANINTQDDEGTTPLMDAVGHCCESMVDFLLARGATVNIRDKEGNTALHRAVRNYPDIHTVRQLLLHGADPNCPNQQGQTPLTVAQNPIDPDYKSTEVIAVLKHSGK